MVLANRYFLNTKPFSSFRSRRGFFYGCLLAWVSFWYPEIAISLEFPLQGDNGERIFGYGRIDRFALSPEGTTLAVKNDTGLFFWNVSLGIPTLKKYQPERSCQSLAFRPDGKLVTVGEQLITWDGDTWEQEGILIPKTKDRYESVFSSNGRFWAEIGSKNEEKKYPLSVWDLVEGKLVVEMLLDGSEGDLFCPQVSSDGHSFFAWFSRIQQAKVWDLQNPEKSLTLQLDEPQSFSMHGVADFSPDGQSIVAGSTEGNVYLWKIDNPNWVWKRPVVKESVFYVQFTPDNLGILIDSSGRDSNPLVVNDGIGMVLLDVETGRTLVEFEETGHKSSNLDLRYSSDGRLVCGMLKDEILFWDGESGKIIQRFQGGHRPYTHLAISRTGTLAAVCVGIDQPTELKVFDYAKGNELYSFTNENHYLSAPIFSPDGKLLMIACGEGTQIIDLVTGRIRLTLDTHGFVQGYSISRDNRYALILPMNSQSCQRWNLLSGELMQVLGHSGMGAPGESSSLFHSTDFSPVSDRYALLVNQTLEIRHTENDEILLTKDLSEYDNLVNRIQFSNDGSHIYLSTASSFVMIQASNGEVVQILEAGQNQGANLGWISVNEKDHFMADSSNSMTFPTGNLRIWNLVSQEKMMESSWRSAGACFSPDGDSIILLFQDNTVRVFDCNRFISQSKVESFVEQKSG